MMGMGQLIQGFTEGWAEECYYFGDAHHYEARQTGFAKSFCGRTTRVTALCEIKEAKRCRKCERHLEARMH